MKYLYGTAVMAAALASAQAEEVGALVPLALEFLARASSTSEVLTLNLTNLLILIVLKALIFGFGLFAVGEAANARSSDSGPSIGETDLSGGMCFLMYTAGDDSKLSCIQRAACVDTKTATDYASAAKMWAKVNKLLGLEFPSQYEVVLNALEDATNHSQRGGECSIYSW